MEHSLSNSLFTMPFLDQPYLEADYQKYFAIEKTPPTAENRRPVPLHVAKKNDLLWSGWRPSHVVDSCCNFLLRKLALLLFLMQKPLPTGHLISSDEEILGRLWDAIDGPTSQIDRQ